MHRSSRNEFDPACSAGGLCRTSGTPISVTDGERLHDIEQKLRCWGYLSHYRDAEGDVAWLLDQLIEWDGRIAELESRLRRSEWMFSLP